MKNLGILIVTLTLLLVTGCTGVKTQATGLENEAFLTFVGNPIKYIGGVDVNIDDSIVFEAKVTKDYAKRPKGKTYAISTGTHSVKITYKSEVIFQKQIFVAAQETKKIMLP
ncbi:MAG: hypothetical protein LBR17_03055 [Bacteroidales bacterium]|jgi:hypothetical protein|nr:hypothetical protein [Bacteroidales bacterium]